MSVTQRPNYKLAQKEKFLLKRGLHFEKISKPGEPLAFKTYSRKEGENVVESNIDLERLFGRTKFARLDPRFHATPEGQERGIPAPTIPNLEKMSEDELRQFADEEGIDHKDIKKGNVKELAKRIKDEL